MPCSLGCLGAYQCLALFLHLSHIHDPFNSPTPSTHQSNSTQSSDSLKTASHMPLNRAFVKLDPFTLSAAWSTVLQLTNLSSQLICWELVCQPHYAAQMLPDLHMQISVFCSSLILNFPQSSPSPARVPSDSIRLHYPSI